MGGDWNVTVPVDHTLVGSVSGEIRDVTSATKIVFSKEHVPPSTSSAGGQHIKGAARIYLDSVATSVDPEGNALATSDTSDNGRVQCLTGASNALQVYVGTSAGVSTGWQNVACKRVYLADTMNANSLPIIGLPIGTVTGNPIHVGQIDTTYNTLYQPATSALLRPKLVSTYLAASGQDGITVLKTRLQIEKYDSGWFSATGSTTYTKAHSLTGIPQLVLVYFGTANDNSGDVAMVGICGGDYGVNNASLCNVDATNVVVRTMTNIAYYRDAAGDAQAKTTGYLKIVALYFNY